MPVSSRAEAGPTDWLRGRGRVVEAEGRTPVRLSDPELAWVVASGRADVFAVHMDGAVPIGPRHHLFSAGPGEALFGTPSAGPGAPVLIAVGVVGTRLVELSVGELARLGADRPEELGALVE